MKVALAKAVIGNEEQEAVRKVLASGWLTDGPKNEEFEEIFAKFLGVKHAFTVNSCTSALFVALKALDIKGEVIVPSFTFVASANAIVTAGARPVFADIEYGTCNIDVNQLENLITKKTEAIMPVHFAGQPAQMDTIMALARKYKLAVIEDSAETIGAKYKGKQAGSFGIGCFSFFPTKNITTGEGGMVTTNDSSFAVKMKTLIGHGIQKSAFKRQKARKPWYRNATMAGYNFRMSNLLAALGVEQMKRLKKMNALRQKYSGFLNRKLKENSAIDLPVNAKSAQHVYQMYTIKLRDPRRRDRFVHNLRRSGVEASVHFDPPVHLQQFYKKHFPARKNQLSVTERVANSIVTLPMHPLLTKNELNHIIKTIYANT